MKPFAPDHPTIRLLLRELEYGPSTVHDLKAALGQCYSSVRCAVRYCRSTDLIHVVGWERVQGGRAVYGVGPGADAKRPPQLTQRERNARRRKTSRQQQQERLLSVFSVKD